MIPEVYPFVVRPLPYEYDDLLPVLDEDTLRFHHDKHYKAYVDKLNRALADYPEMQKMTLRELLVRLEKLPQAVHADIRKYGGGVYNHAFYFDGLTYKPDQTPEGRLKEAVERDFGSLRDWCEQMLRAAQEVFGSGWVWLAADAAGKLSILQTANQDTPDLKNYRPLAALDVWEHAYYLQYQNRREEYVQGWLRLINWRKAERLYEAEIHESGKLSERAG